MKKLMQFLSKLFPASATGENPVPVKLMYIGTSLKDFFRKYTTHSKSQWPYYTGNYQIINPKGHIAICTLTSNNLIPKEALAQHIAIMGTVITPNLGIERIIQNTISNPNIRYLLLCGKDSPMFKAGQAIECLFKYGINQEKRIINAEGHFPVLKNLSQEKIDHFINQIELISIKDEKQLESIQQKINEIPLHTEPYNTPKMKENRKSAVESFTELKAGGKRVPLDYDKNGFFIITVDNSTKEIIVKHYERDNKPGYIIKGRSSESILLAIIEKELISQMSHAGYLGAELSKAETALQLNLWYTQDQKLKTKQPR